MNSKIPSIKMKITQNGAMDQLVKKSVPGCFSFFVAKGAFDNGAKSVYCGDPNGIKEPLLVTNIEQAREYYKDIICNENTPKSITKILRTFTKEEIAQRFLRFMCGKELDN